jgi:Ca-activated chloride channel family protein
MYGFPLEISKAILRKLISSLRPTDIFNILLFEFSRSMLSDRSLPATPRNIENALALISEQQGRGGTELYPALQTAFDFKTTPEFARTFIIITDGYVTIESKAFQLVQERRNQANLFALGIGNDVNRHLIEGLAYAGAGEAYFITNRTEAETVGEKLIQDIAMPLWSHIEVEWGGFDAYEVEPVPTPDLFADKPVILYGKYRGNPSDIIRLKGKTASGDFEQTIPVDKAEMTQSEALRYLWARNRIKYLSDYASYFEDGVSFRYRNETPRHQRQITDLGLKYNLLTKYTSFLAVDEKEEELNEIEDGVVVQAEEILYSIKAPSPIFARLKRSVDSFTVCLFDDEAEEPEMECSEPVISSCEAKKETKPSFPGGKKAFKKWLYKHLQYPSECALMSGVTVIVEFTVDETGSVSNVRIVRSIHPLLDAEAIRVISLSPNWFPGIRDGAPVKMEHTFPVVFKYKRKNLLKRFFKHEK